MEEVGAGSCLGIMRPLVGLRSNEHNWPHRLSVNSIAQGCSDPYSGLYPRPNFRELGLLGRSPEPLALILARVRHPHVLTSLHLLQAVLVHFLLGEDEEEDTTGEADGPRDGEMCTGFGQGLGLSQRSPALPLVQMLQRDICLPVLYAECWRDPTNQSLLLLPALDNHNSSLLHPGQLQTPRHGTKSPVWSTCLFISPLMAGIHFSSSLVLNASM